MKKSILAIAFAFVSAAVANEGTTTNSPIRFGVDFGVPYFLTADGNKVNDRGNYNIGADLRYFTTENLNIGLRAAYDLEDKNGFRQINVAPGVQYHWMTTETFVPYVRLDVPVTIQGAPNSSAADDKMDVGTSAGAGVAWNLGNSIGVNNLSLRYDFNISYTYGIKTAVPVLGLEFAKVGVDYRF